MLGLIMRPSSPSPPSRARFLRISSRRSSNGAGSLCSPSVPLLLSGRADNLSYTAYAHESLPASFPWRSLALGCFLCACSVLSLPLQCTHKVSCTAGRHVNLSAYPVKHQDAFRLENPTHSSWLLATECMHATLMILPTTDKLSATNQGNGIIQGKASTGSAAECSECYLYVARLCSLSLLLLCCLSHGHGDTLHTASSTQPHLLDCFLLPPHSNALTAGNECL